MTILRRMKKAYSEYRRHMSPFGWHKIFEIFIRCMHFQIMEIFDTKSDTHAFVNNHTGISETTISLDIS